MIFYGICGVFLSYRKLRFHTIKTLREDRTAAERKNVACATRCRRRILLRRILFHASDLDIAMINKFYDLATMQPTVPATVQSHYELLKHKASECIGCQACESRCPFGVPIAERMKKTAELFGC